MRQLLLPGLLICVQGMLWAQDLATISGQVLDNQTRIGLPMANVILSNRFDSTMVTGTVSEVDGHFTLTGIPNGNFILSFSFVGYEDQALPMLIGDLNHIFDVGEIALTPDNRQLGEVVVATGREIVSSGLEKKIFGVEENISQQGSSVLDALRNLPGVTISADGKVLLRGSDQVAILIDGKQSSLTGFSNQKGLDNLPATNIDKIEIINNPSARYNASGMAGLINVIYRKETKTGFNGEASLNVGVGELWQRQENLPRITPKYAQTPKVNPSINMNYRTTRANWFFQSSATVRCYWRKPASAAWKLLPPISRRFTRPASSYCLASMSSSIRRWPKGRRRPMSQKLLPPAAFFVRQSLTSIRS